MSFSISIFMICKNVPIDNYYFSLYNIYQFPKKTYAVWVPYRRSKLSKIVNTFSGKVSSKIQPLINGALQPHNTLDGTSTMSSPFSMFDVLKMRAYIVEVISCID